MGETRQFGYGLIGCGGFGEFCIEAYRTLPQVRPVAVADVRGEAVEHFRKRFGVRGYADAGELIADPNVDLVHVATPPSSHADLALQALRAGKHVLCEKPLAVTAEDADEMLAAARRARRICPVDFVLRYNAVTRAVRAVLDAGMLGKVLRAQLTNCATDLPRDHWFWDPSVGGGIFIEHGVHFFDLYRYWLGPARVTAARAIKREGSGEEDRVECSLLFESGTLATHYHGFDQLRVMDRTDHRLVCETGDIVVEGWIPLRLTVDAAMDEAGQHRLAALLPGAEVEVTAELGSAGPLRSRGQDRAVDRRVRLTYEPQPDKSAAYAESLRELLRDQLTAATNPRHVREVTEADGRDALIQAVEARDLSQR